MYLTMVKLIKRFWVQWSHRILKMIMLLICGRYLHDIKGTVNVISSDPSMQRWQFPIFNSNLKTFNWSRYINSVSAVLRLNCTVYSVSPRFRGVQVILKIFQHKALFTWWTVKGLKGTVVNRALLSLHGGSFKITLTVPLLHDIILLIIFGRR